MAQTMRHCATMLAAAARTTRSSFPRHPAYFHRQARAVSHWKHLPRCFTKPSPMSAVFNPPGAKMRAIFADGAGGTIIRTVDVPTPTADEVLLNVKAAGLNRADLLQIAGKYPPPRDTTAVLGLEAAGLLPDGRPAAALLLGGGFAEYVAVPRSALLPLDTNVIDSLTWTQLAAIPEAFVAAYHFLFDKAAVCAGDAVLLNAAGSGVGTSIIQLAATVPDVHIIAIAGSDRKLSICRRLGAQTLINYNEKDAAAIADCVKHATLGRGASVVLDCVGPAHFPTLAKAAARDARWVMYGLLSGARGDGVNLAPIVTKRLSLFGATLRSLPVMQRGEIIAAFSTRFGDEFGTGGRLHAVIDREVHGMERAAEAFAYLASNASVGKVVLHVP